MPTERLQVVLEMITGQYKREAREAAGATKKVASEAETAGTAATRMQGGMLSAAKGIGALAAAGAALKVGQAIFEIGEELDKAVDKIRVGTGATGEALKGLTKDFEATFSSVPATAEDAATAVADLNTRLGLTGEPLQVLSEQFLELSRLTGSDLNQLIQETTRTFGDWSIATEDTSAALDLMFRAAQQTGIPITKLQQLIVQYGAPLRQMGFGFEEATALMSSFQKEGVNVELVLGSLRIALGKMARQGIADPAAALRDLITQIQQAGSTGEANALALETFGARAGPDMAAAIREGRFAVDDLIQGITSGTDTILGASEDTRSWSESLQLLKNRITLALGPAASRIFQKLSDVVDQSSDSLVGLADAIGAVIDAAADVPLDVIQPLLDVLRPIGDLARGYSNLRRNAEELQGSQSGLERTLGRLQELGLKAIISPLGAVLSAIEDLTGGTKEADNAIGAMTPSIKAATSGYGQMGEKANEADRAMRNSAQHGQVAAKFFRDIADQSGNAAPNLRDMAAAIRDVRSAMLEAANPAFAAIEAVKRRREAEQNYQETLADGKSTEEDIAAAAGDLAEARLEADAALGAFGSANKTQLIRALESALSDTNISAQELLETWGVLDKQGDIVWSMSLDIPPEDRALLTHVASRARRIIPGGPVGGGGARGQQHGGTFQPRELLRLGEGNMPELMMIPGDAGRVFSHADTRAIIAAFRAAGSGKGGGGDVYISVPGSQDVQRDLSLATTLAGVLRRTESRRR